MLGDWRLRASPWIALLLGLIFIIGPIGSQHGKVNFGDLYPGICLLAASALLFGLVRWVDALPTPKNQPDPEAVMPQIVDDRPRPDRQPPDRPPPDRPPSPTQIESESPS